MSITKFSVYKTKILLFKSKKKHEISALWIFVVHYISVYLYSTIANMLFNLETNVLKRVGKGGMDHVSQRKKKPFHDSRVLKKQFHGKLDSP
jgi:hypothetical protein